MSGQLQKFTNATIYFNNKLLTLMSSVTVDRESGIKPVNTAYRFAGIQQGTNFMTVNVDSCVPLAGMEQDVGDAMLNGDIVQLTIVAASKTLTAKGFIEKDNFSYSGDNQAKLTFSAHLEFASWS